MRGIHMLKHSLLSLFYCRLVMFLLLSLHHLRAIFDASMEGSGDTHSPEWSIISCLAKRCNYCLTIFWCSVVSADLFC